MYQEMLDLTKELVKIPSINSTTGEVAIGKYIESYIREIPYFKEHPEYVIISPLKNDKLGRRNVLALLRGEKELSGDTILFHGHTDTVGVDDFGSLKDLAFSPEELMKKLEEIELEPDVKQDLTSGDYLFGRGALDMKSGDAVFLVLLKEFASSIKNLNGNILVSFNPVEENSHTGIIESVPILLELKEKYDLEYKLAINNDFTCPMYTGDRKRYVYTGVGGKLLPCFYIQGKETHVGQCFEGFDPSLVAAKLVEQIAYNPAFSDNYEGEYSVPPTVLKMQDLKKWYNVQTADSAFVYFNYFVHQAPINTIMEQLKKAGEKAFTDSIQLINGRYKDYSILNQTKISDIHYPVKVMYYEELLRRAIEEIPDILTEMNQLTVKHIKEEMDKRLAAMEIVKYLLLRIHYKEPVIVLFFATPYCPFNVVTKEEGEVLNQIKKVTLEVEKEFSEEYELHHFFPSLSDSSYLRISDTKESLEILIHNFPEQNLLYPLPLKEIKQLDIPAVNYGVYGKDAHKWTERVQLSYSFHVLPELIKKTVAEILS